MTNAEWNAFLVWSRAFKMVDGAMENKITGSIIEVKTDDQYFAFTDGMVYITDSLLDAKKHVWDNVRGELGWL